VNYRLKIALIAVLAIVGIIVIVTGYRP